MSCFRSLHDGVGGSWRIGSKKLFMPFRAPTSHGNTPFRTTFRHPFHPANITRTVLRSFFATPDTFFSFRYVGSMGSMKRLRTTKVLCADHECWLLIIQFRLFIYWLLIYSIIYLFIHLLLSISLLSLFSFFFVHWWADSTEIFLTTFIRIITFQSHSWAWQVDLIKYNKKHSLVSVTSHHKGLEAGLEDDIFHPPSVLVLPVVWIQSRFDTCKFIQSRCKSIHPKCFSCSRASCRKFCAISLLELLRNVDLYRNDLNGW